jgi:hypothetical protein
VEEERKRRQLVAVALEREAVAPLPRVAALPRAKRQQRGERERDSCGEHDTRCDRAAAALCGRRGAAHATRGRGAASSVHARRVALRRPGRRRGAR